MLFDPHDSENHYERYIMLSIPITILKLHQVLRKHSYIYKFSVCGSKYSRVPTYNGTNLLTPCF